MKFYNFFETRFNTERNEVEKLTPIQGSEWNCELRQHGDELISSGLLSEDEVNNMLSMGNLSLVYRIFLKSTLILPFGFAAFNQWGEIVTVCGIIQPSQSVVVETEDKEYIIDEWDV